MTKSWVYRLAATSMLALLSLAPVVHLAPGTQPLVSAATICITDSGPPSRPAPSPLTEKSPEVVRTHLDPLAALPPSDIVTFVDGKRLFGEVIPRLLTGRKDLGEEFDTALQEVRAVTGLDPREMTRIATGLRFRQPTAATTDQAALSSWVGIARGVDYGKWLAFVRQRRQGASKESRHGGKTFHVLELNERERQKVGPLTPLPLEGGELAVAALDADAVAFGAPAGVRSALDAGAAGGAKVNADLVAAAARTPEALIGVAGLVAPSFIPDLLSGSNHAESELGKALSSLTQFSAAVESAPAGLALSTRVSVGSAEQAKTLGDVLTAFKTLAGIAPANNARDKFYREIIKGLSVSSADNEVRVRAEFTQATFTAMAGQFVAGIYNLSGLAHRDRGDLAAAVADFDRAIALDPGGSVAYANRAKLISGKGDLAGAVADYDKAVALDPHNAQLYNNRGFILVQKGDFDAALADLNKAIELNPGHAYAYNNRGRALFKRGNLPEALDDYDRSIALDGKNALAYSNRGFARHRQGEFERALADFDKAVALDPKLAEAYTGRGFARMDQGDHDGAVADFDKAVALDPKSADAYNGRGLVRYSNEEWDGAISDFERAIALTPDDAGLYVNRGVARAGKDDLAAALADFNKAIAVSPDLAEAYNWRGVVRREQGDFAQAIADLSKAITVRPDYAEAYGQRALSRLALGRDAEAAHDLKKCFELNAALRPVFEALAEEVIEARRAKRRRPH